MTTYNNMKSWERDSRKAAQHRQYLRRKALGIQKKTKSGTQCESQKYRNTSEYKQWRSAVLEAGVCNRCESTSNLIAHHILSASQYPEVRLDKANGECICKSCHDKVHLS